MGGPGWYPNLSMSHVSSRLSLGLVHAFILFSLSVSLTATGLRLIHPSIVAGHPEHAGATESQIKVAPQRVSVQPPVGVGRARGRAVRGPLRADTFQPL